MGSWDSGKAITNSLWRRRKRVLEIIYIDPHLDLSKLRVSQLVDAGHVERVCEIFSTIYHTNKIPRRTLMQRMSKIVNLAMLVNLHRSNTIHLFS